MTTLDQRENAFETQFAHQEELKFRARERAVRDLALWAGGRLGMTGDALETYAREMVAADILNPAAEATIERIADVLAPKGIGKDEVHRMMEKFMAAADLAVRSPTRPSR